MSRKSFVWYQVSEELNTEVQELYFLSPLCTYEQVDLPFWKERQRYMARSGIEISIRQVATSTNLLDLFRLEQEQRQKQEASFVTPTIRRELSSFLEPNQNDNLLVEKFEGRHLLLQEVINVIQVHTNQPEEHTILNTLQRLYLQGVFDWSTSIGLGLDCQRCGYGTPSEGSWWMKWLENITEQHLIQVECATCRKKDCYYCPRCLHLGIAKSCEPFLAWYPAHEGRATELSFSWSGELSPAQRHASDKLSQFVHGSSKGQNEPTTGSNNEFLVYAVCGAGKTEILFQTIYQSLAKQHKVLITSPRRDVIVELAPRLKEAFPQTKVCVLHGESNEKYQAGDLFLATTHQTLRFQSYFDLVVIDEEDAYPYHADPMLSYVVQRAKKILGHLIYLTATPRDDMQRRVEIGELQAVRITQRFHGYPLAIPKIQVVGAWRRLMEKKEVISEMVHYATHLLLNQRYGYLFVPFVKDLAVVKEYIEETIFPYIKSSFVVETVHSEDPRRMELVQRYRAQEIQLLITTTILERGVTISHSDVGILGSDDPTFDVASLIQMSGRAGRKAADPVGNVWFYPEVRTNTQMKAIRTIKECNQFSTEGGSA